MQKLKNVSYIRAEGNKANTITTAKGSILYGIAPPKILMNPQYKKKKKLNKIRKKQNGKTLLILIFNAYFANELSR